MNSALLPPGQRWKYLAHAFLIAGGLIALLVCSNWQYLFHSALYEWTDYGADSLSVLRAKRFHEIYGAYSRYDLHHPGPALFYAFAWAEELFYSALHLPPTPYNAQVLASMILCASFFAGAVCVAARWVRSRFFLPLALLLGALHYTAVDPHWCLLSTWPPFTMPMIFLALLVASASVGAGQGEDLPLLILAGGFAVHSNLGQPLFVLPLFVLGYLGLSLNCHRVARVARPAAAAPDPPGAGVSAEKVVSAAPWRQFPRAHGLAALVLFMFVLPLLADLCKGTNSNIWGIFHNLPRDASKHHPWLACVYYFIRFGGYRPSMPGAEYNFSGHASAVEIRHFCATHLKMAILWPCALFAPLAALALGRWRRRAGTLPVLEDVPARTRRWRFLAWLFACWVVSIGLTLYWVHIIEIEMSYYHAWFNYSIWFVLLLFAATALSEILEVSALHSPRPWLWVGMVALVSILGVTWTVASHPERFRETLFNDPMSLAQAASIKGALAEQSGGSRTKLISFPVLGAETATGIAVLLERLGYDARVAPQWLDEFGRNHAPPDLFEGLTWNADGSLPFDVWRVVPAAADPAAAARRPLIHNYGLVLTQPTIDPNAGLEINFTGAQPNYDSYVVAGWTLRLTDVPFVWTEGTLGLLCFRPQPIPAGASVEVVCDCFPLLAKGIRDVQRVKLAMNREDLGQWSLDTPVPAAPPRVLIPAAVWNKRPLAVLTLRFLDPVAPKDLHENDDPRLLALGTRKIIFRTINAPVPP